MKQNNVVLKFLSHARSVLLLSVVLLLAAMPVNPETLLEAGRFSTAAPGSEFPDSWKPLTFPKIERHTAYSLVRDGDIVVLKAVSQAAASGLTRDITINPSDYPVVQWRWKITNLIQKSDVTRKDGDDYPARLYITFQYDSSRVGLFERAKYEIARLLYGEYPPLGALNYIWANKEAKGTMVRNAYTDRARMIAVENGESPLNTWVTEKRNLLEDYRRAFGATADEIPMISGIAVMTDTDNTGESVTSYFGDIVFKKSPD
jgi:DUF3047 family protein